MLATADEAMELAATLKSIPNTHVRSVRWGEGPVTSKEGRASTEIEVHGSEEDIRAQVQRFASEARIPVEVARAHSRPARESTFWTYEPMGQRLIREGPGSAGLQTHTVSTGNMVIVISGPSGVGKDTVIRELRSREPRRPRDYIVTYKTRPQREGEEDGQDYHFVTKKQFDAKRASGYFVETAEVYGHWSGTPIDQILAALENGRDAVVKVDVQGAKAIRARIPESVLIFIAPDSFDWMMNRLISRPSETSEEQLRRIGALDDELAAQDKFDWVLVTRAGEAPATADEIEEIVSQEHRLYPDRQAHIVGYSAPGTGRSR